MSTSQLCDFLIWFLYYDVVDLPSTPDEWYELFKTTEMRGWIEFGTLLAQCQAVGQGYGLDLPVLDSICDRLRLQKALVRDMLIKFSSPPKMRYGLLATVVKREEEKGTMTHPKLVIFESRLTAMLQLANRLRPTSRSQYVMWQMGILKRINKLLLLYITPRLIHAREKGPLLGHATNQNLQNLPKEVMEGLYLAFLFEAMQLERTVTPGKKVTYAASSSSVSNETPSNRHTLPDQRDGDEVTTQPDPPTIRCSWPYGADMPGASMSGHSTPERLNHRFERHG